MPQVVKVTSLQSGRQPVPTRKVLGISVNRDEPQGVGRRPGKNGVTAAGNSGCPGR